MPEAGCPRARARPGLLHSLHHEYSNVVQKVDPWPGIVDDVLVHQHMCVHVSFVETMFTMYVQSHKNDPFHVKAASCAKVFCR